MLVSYGITDDVIGDVHSSNYVWWESGQTKSFNRTYTIKDDDSDPLKNNASLMVVGSLGGYIIPETYFEDSVSVDIFVPSIEVTKSAQPNPATVGDTIRYNYTVTNTGDVPLYDVTLEDDKIGGITLEDNILSPGESITATGTDTANDVGNLTNKATATGKYTIGNDEYTITDTAELTVTITEAPVLTGNVRIEKRKVPWDYEEPKLMSLSGSPGLPHEKVTFRLMQVEGGLTYENETDENGILEFNDIPVDDYMLEEDVPKGYEFDYWDGDINEDNVISVDDNDTAEIIVINRELPKGTIKVVKTLNTRDGEPHIGVPFELNRHRIDEEEQILASYVEEDGWPRIDYTDEEGEILFDNLECDGYYYTLREIGMDDYKVEYQYEWGDPMEEGEEIHTCPGEGPTIYVINTKKGDDESSGGGGSSRRRPRTVEEEPIEVPEEPEVFTPPVEEPVEEPVVVEEPPVTAPVLPDLPHTGGNPAAFVIMGAALAGLGLYVRKRR